MNRQPWQERVVLERTELQGKICKLTIFVGEDRFSDLPVKEQVRLELQLHYMKSYDQILVARMLEW